MFHFSAPLSERTAENSLATSPDWLKHEHGCLACFCAIRAFDEVRQTSLRLACANVWLAFVDRFLILARTVVAESRFVLDVYESRHPQQGYICLFSFSDLLSLCFLNISIQLLQDHSISQRSIHQRLFTEHTHRNGPPMSKAIIPLGTLPGMSIQPDVKRSCTVPTKEIKRPQRSSSPTNNDSQEVVEADQQA